MSETPPEQQPYVPPENPEISQEFTSGDDSTPDSLSFEEIQSLADSAPDDQSPEWEEPVQPEVVEDGVE